MVSDGGAANSKAALRRVMRQRLASLDPDLARQAAHRATERLLRLPDVESAAGVFTCLSFDTEIDTHEFVEGLLSAGRRVFVPRADLASHRLFVHPYPCELEALDFGLSQPLSTEPELKPQAIDRTIDVAVIVGLAFDRRGYRLGYGKGFFDRFLVGRPFPTIGLAYDLQVVDQLPSEPHDVPLEAVVTELRALRPGSDGR